MLIVIAVVNYNPFNASRIYELKGFTTIFYLAPFLTQQASNENFATNLLYFTLFDLPQNTKNDKTRQLHKSK